MEAASNPVGRPSKYNAELQAKADEYVLFGYEEQGDLIPSLAGLCCYLGVVRSTAHDWRGKHPEFSGTLEAIEVKQENIALNGALAGRLNATIAKLVLANHGYSDKIEQSHTSPDGSMSPSSSQDAVLAALARKHQD